MTIRVAGDENGVAVVVRILFRSGETVEFKDVSDRSVADGVFELVTPNMAYIFPLDTISSICSMAPEP